MVELILDGQSLAQSVPGTLVTKKPNIPAAKRDVQFTDVPGRLSGSLTEKRGWKDITWSPELQLVDFKTQPVMAEDTAVTAIRVEASVE